MSGKSNYTRNYLPLLIALVAPTLAIADGGESGGGGDYADAVILDRIEFGNPVKDPRIEYKSAYALVSAKLEVLRKQLPDLAEDLERAFDSKSLRWYKAKNTVVPTGNPPDPRVMVSDLKRGLQQTEHYVLIDPSFEGKSDEAKADGLIHEMVRNLSKRLQQGRSAEDKIRETSQYLLHIGDDETADAISEMVRSRGFGSYPTDGSSKRREAAYVDFYQQYCLPVFDGLLKLNAQEQALMVTQAKKIDQFMAAEMKRSVAYPRVSPGFQKSFIPTGYVTVPGRGYSESVGYSAYYQELFAVIPRQASRIKNGEQSVEVNGQDYSLTEANDLFDGYRMQACQGLRGLIVDAPERKDAVLMEEAIRGPASVKAAIKGLDRPRSRIGACDGS